jgi:formate-dependent nitrite reductase membrane component NrfD
MSHAEVRRDGLGGVSPGREARMWSRNGGGATIGRQPTEHTGGSYYGDPIINPPVWEERNIAGYLFAGGLAGASSILAAGGDLTGRRRLARRAKLCASAAIGVSLAALIADLGRPARFLNMLRVVKPTSPMSIGTWILVAYAPLNATATASELTGLAPRSGRVASTGAGLLGSAVATYTGALFANTAVPAWSGGRRELPFLFAGSAAAAAGGFGLLAAPREETGPARRMAFLGVAGEMVATAAMERSLGTVAQSLHSDPAHARLRAARALSAAGALGAVTLAGRSRVAAGASGAALLAGSALTRFGLFAAGMASARDPRHTVEPQRQRLEERADS